MSSYSSDGEYGASNHQDQSDGELDGRGPRTPERNFKGPCTPKSMSPRSPSSPPCTPSPSTRDRSPHSGGPKSPDDIRSPMSDSQGRVSPPRARGRPPRSPQEPHPAVSVKDDPEDDVHSDISSSSSLLNKEEHKDEETQKTKFTKSSGAAVPDAEDLSDVSDLDEDSEGLVQDDDTADNDKSQDGEVDDEEEDVKQKQTDELDKSRLERSKRESIQLEDDGEQLDFEADDQTEVDKDDGEVGGRDAGQTPAAAAAAASGAAATVTDRDDKNNEDDEDEGEDKSGDEGEVKDDESLEEGEVTDEGDPKPEKPPICRFFSRGACTWGVNCRFLHPGVTDKGNYSMFEVGRPMVAPPVGSGHYPEHRSPYGHVLAPPARVPPSPYGPGLIPVRRDEAESAWERGLRQAKEMMRKSTKRKETDMDFEEKKMNLSIGQDEIDKENDYYARAPSPIDEPEAWNRLSPRMEGDARRPVRVVERYEDIIPDRPVSPSAYYEKYEYRRGHEPAREYPPVAGRKEKKYYGEDELGKKTRRDKMVREVIVQRVEKQRGDEKDNLRRRGDEWADPWMRSKSPGRKGGEHRSRKTSYSSGSSSFTSRSNSRSSSNSSYTSYSRSRSPSLSRSRSPTAKTRRPRTPPIGIKTKKQITSSPAVGPPDPKFKPVGGPEKKAPADRPMLMNPPAPTPKRNKERPLSPSAMRKVGLNPPPPTSRPAGKHGGKAGKVKSRKSRSSSGSGSSGSSSDSSRSSYSSSSSSTRGGTPPVRAVKQPRKIEINERAAAQAVKLKALDALKVTGQKPQIKLTLKPAETVVVGKKRPAEEPLTVETTKAPSAGKAPAGKKTTSRREELLKQLKAVEDAIARKRSKI